MTLGLDIDGVLANFNQSYIALASKRLNRPIATHEPEEWNYLLNRGVLLEEETKLWEWIEDNPQWWEELSGYEENISAAFCIPQEVDVYYISSRPTPALRHTKNWLKRMNLGEAAVILTYEKGPVARALKLDYFIDDRPENCLEVKGCHSSCHVTMLSRPWNQHYQREWTGTHYHPERKIHLASTLKEALRPLSEAASPRLSPSGELQLR